MDFNNKSQHTCLTCAVTFQDALLQRDHYKTDWHRYNLKRKVAEMPPINLEVFEQKMENQAAQMKLLSGEVKKPTGYCVSCRKNFNTEKAYLNHLNSKKHKEIAATFNLKKNKDEIANNRFNRKPAESMDTKVNDAAEDLEMEELDSDEWEDIDDDTDIIEGSGDSIPTNICLFCPQMSKDLEKNMIHMSEKHSFFIPDLDFIIDVEGLLKHLRNKIGVGYICLTCDDRSKQFQSLDSVQKHMISKGHCKMKTEGNAFLDYIRFYDYSSSYPTAVVGANQDEDDNSDEEVEVEHLDDTGYELVLPSGARVGHRSLMHYYKQNLNPDRQIQTQRSLKPVLNKYKALGWTGSTGVDAKRRAKDVVFMNNLKQKHYMKLGTKANKLQRHFVDPTM